MTDSDRDALLDWARQIDRPNPARLALQFAALLTAFALGALLCF